MLSSRVKSVGLLIFLLIVAANLFAGDGEPIVVKNTTVQKNVVLTQAQIGEKMIELECFLTRVPCTPPESGRYVMVRLGAGEGAYQDCTNVDLYRVRSAEEGRQKVGTYCLLQDDANCYIDCNAAQVPTITPEQMQVKSKVVLPAPIEILTDTQGVDFSPYLQQVVRSVQARWFELIPAVARKPQMKQGTVTIEFAILNDGRVSGMKLQGPSGDTDMDRAAWYGITQSNPFAPLPAQFHGKYLGLRFHFHYNPDANTSVVRVQ